MKKSKSRTYNYQSEQIRNRLGDREYSLGLDLGVGSIGAAVVALEPDEDGVLYASDPVFACSRVFASSEGASTRREKRGHRNSLRHRSNRLKHLWKLLARKGLMLPFSEEVVTNPQSLRFSEESMKKDPYTLRYKGLREELTLEELGVALYHIANHRGSSSVRSFLGDKKIDEKEKESLQTTADIAKAYNLNTFIEVLYKFNETAKDPCYRNKPSRQSLTCVPMPTRDIIKSEFNQLMSTQQRYHQDILTDEYISSIEGCIFFENPKIVPEAGNCPYFPNEKKLPKASFINEERRLWEALNNVVLTIDKQVPDGRIKSEKFKLNKEEKQILFDKYLRKGTELKEKTIKKEFPQYKLADIILQGAKKDATSIKGFRFCKLENFEPFKSLSKEDKDKYIATYVNTPDDVVLITKLQNVFKFTKEEAERAISESGNLVGDYAPVGPTAMELLMPFIINDGLSFHEAEEEAIKNGVLFEDIEKKEYDHLPYYGEVIPNSTQQIMGKAWHSSYADKLDLSGIDFQLKLEEKSHFKLEDRNKSKKLYFFVLSKEKAGKSRQKR